MNDTLIGGLESRITIMDASRLVYPPPLFSRRQGEGGGGRSLVGMEEEGTVKRGKEG
jgi:hypothetical protein